MLSLYVESAGNWENLAAAVGRLILNAEYDAFVIKLHLYSEGYFGPPLAVYFADMTSYYVTKLSRNSYRSNILQIAGIYHTKCLEKSVYVLCTTYRS